MIVNETVDDNTIKTTSNTDPIGGCLLAAWPWSPWVQSNLIMLISMQNASHMKIAIMVGRIFSQFDPLGQFGGIA